jgi:hypothetical protein
MPGFLSGNPGNGYIPSFEASGKLVVGYSRNPKDFAINKWTTLTKVTKGTGYYLRITPENAARILDTTLANYVWPDGNDAPTGVWNMESFEFEPFLTKRYSYSFRVGYKAVEQAAWRILAVEAAFHAQQAMTAREVVAITKATTSGNWPASQVKTATTLGGGFWDTGTATSPVLKKGLNAGAFVINKGTLGIVRPKDLVLVISPETADKFGRTQEVHTYLKESPYALAQVRGDDAGQNGIWGLPDQLYGYNIVVDDTVYITSQKNVGGLAAAPAYAMPSNSALLLGRPGGLMGVEGSPSFSTVHVFSYEEMTVESKDDPDNRRHQGRVTDDFGVEIVSPVSGLLVTNLFS